MNQIWDKWFAMGQLRKILSPDFPTIVTLCGSTRFKDAWYAEGKRLTHEGKIVLSVGDLDTSEANRTVNVPLDADLKVRLDDLHKRKIDLSDEILVLNVGGYIGASTRSEIDHATAHGKVIRYLEAVPTAKATMSGKLMIIDDSDTTGKE